MKKILDSMVYLLTVASIAGCPKYADIIHNEQISKLPSSEDCLVMAIKEYDVELTDIRKLNLNSHFNGYTASFNTKISSTSLTIYDPSMGLRLNSETWVSSNATQEQIDELNIQLNDIIHKVKQTCEQEVDSANNTPNSDAR